MKLPQPFKSSELIHVVIETPKGSSNKFVYDHEGEYFLLKKILPAGNSFPVHVGFVPHTRSGDGQPLDVFVYMEGSSYPGCIVACRVLGIAEIEQTKNGTTYRNDRVIAIPFESTDHKDAESVDDLPVSMVNELLNFCRYYLEMEGNKFNVLQIKGRAAALAAVQKLILEQK